MGELVLQVRGDEQGGQTLVTQGSSKAKMLWKMRDAKDRGDAYYGQIGDQKIVHPDVVRQELWDKHLQNPSLALAEALRKVEVWKDADSLTVEARSSVCASSERFEAQDGIRNCQGFAARVL